MGVGKRRKRREREEERQGNNYRCGEKKQERN